ncbi:MAG: hypothetical protein AAGU11_01650, partial [Syntrophobacteraceae bacterium]
FREDARRLWKLRGEFRQYGCKLTKWWGGLKLFALDGAPVRWARHLYPSVDIMPTKRHHDKIVYSRFFARRGWPESYFRSDELFPLTTRAFGSAAMPCPGRHEEYLTRVFGADWDSVAYVSYDHRTEKAIMPRKVRLVNREPALFTLQD